KDRAQADARVGRWKAERQRLVAPTFFEVEADSILRKKIMVTKTLMPDQAAAAFQRLQALPIRSIAVPEQRERAWALAEELGLTTVYDATYLALADLRGCEFWTADERLFNQVSNRLGFVRFLGKEEAP